MSDFKALMVTGAKFEEFSRSFSEVLRALPPEAKLRLKDIQRDYYGAYGFLGACERLNNRTVAQIFAEYQPTDTKPLVSGEMEGLRYELFDAPDPNDRIGQRNDS